MENSRPKKPTRLGNLETVGGIVRIILFHNLKDIPVTNSWILKWFSEKTSFGISERSVKKAFATLNASGILKKSNAEITFNEVNIRGEKRQGMRQVLYIDFLEMLKLHQKYIMKDLDNRFSDYPLEIRRFVVLKYFGIWVNNVTEEMKNAKELLDKYGTAERIKELNSAEYFVWRWQSALVIEYLKAWNGN
jgi:DNA-binding Lrp family transcriptional regulator